MSNKEVKQHKPDALDAVLNRVIGQCCVLHFIFFEGVIKAAPLHDFGKIAIDDVILRKKGKYTPEERAVMKIHPEKGAQIVAKILQNSDDKQFREIAENVAHYHHEKWDGTGYPEGL